jgi:hypothetical protein
VIAETFLESQPGVVSNARIVDYVQQTIVSRMGLLGAINTRRLDANKQKRSGYHRYAIAPAP